MGKTFRRSRNDFDAWEDRWINRYGPDRREDPEPFDPARERAEDDADRAMERDRKRMEREHRI